MRKLGFIIGIIVLLMAVMPLSVPVNDGLPAQAAEPPPPVPQEIPKLPPPQEPLPVIDGHGTGFIAPTMDLSYITGQRMPDGSMVGEPPVGQPVAFDWRTAPNRVTSVKDQGSCGSCYAFASIANVESKILIDTNTTPPGPDYSENNAKECNWRELNNYTTPNPTPPPPVLPWGSCDGGNYKMLASLFSQKGIVLETDDPYVANYTACNSSCPYNKTLLDWRIISTWSVANTNVLKNYIMNYGPVYTTVYVDSSHGFHSGYNGSYTFNYTSSGTNHAVLIVGWSNTLPPDQQTGLPGDGWIVKNSWGAGWGAGGYFYIHYGAANIGCWSSFMYDWQDYDNSGGIMYYDDDCWDNSWGYSSQTGWGLCNFTPINNTYATRVEFWTTDATTDIDIYIYDDFNVATKSLSNLLVSQFNYSFNEAGYHGVDLSSPLALTAGDPVIVVVKFTAVATQYPVPSDPNGLWVTNLTYMSPSGSNGSWYDLGANQNEDVAIRLRTSEVVPSYTLTMAVNGNGTTTPAVGGHAYVVGTVVDINATPDANWDFVNWTGEVAAPDSASTTVTVDENKTVTANFAQVNYTLTMAVSGNGTTTPGEGEHSYINGTVVNINATPDANWDFVNWTGEVGTIANVSLANTTINMTGDYSIVANFAVNRYNLTTSSSSGGNVTVPGEGVFGPYDHGTVVGLDATPDAGYHFVNWTGDTGTIANSTAANTTITMNDNYTIVTNFAKALMNCTCGDICVNETGWWCDGGAFNASATPIQSAVNNATGGEIICVKDGNYHENIDVYTPNLTIQSENGAANCAVNASDSGDHVFDVSVNYTKIIGFTVRGAAVSGKAGIYLDNNVAHCNISDNNASNSRYGIYLYYSSNNTLANNTANSNYDHGIYLYYSSNNTLTNNTANSNNDRGVYLFDSCTNNLTNNTANSNGEEGIYLSYSSNSSLTNNTMSGNKYNFGVIAGMYLSSYIQNIDASNLVDGKPIYYLVNEKDQQVPSDAGFVGLVNSTNITSKDLTLAGNRCGVQLVYTNDSRIENVTVSNTYQGIALSYSCNNNNLTNNNASNNEYGIYLKESSNNNTLTNNTCTNNTYHGIWLSFSSSNNTLTSNKALNNTYHGIWLSFSSNNNTLTNNTANSNIKYGIYLRESSNNNTLTNNTASNNFRGISLSESDGNVLIGNTANTSSGDNGIYLYSSDNNNLTNNTASLNKLHGTCLEDSSSNTLTNNTANSNTAHGIYLHSSSNNTVTNSTLELNTEDGVLLYSSSNNNTFTNNTASNNTFYDFYSGEDSHGNTIEALTIASYPTTLTFTYDNGVSIKGVDTAPSGPSGKVNITKYVNAMNVTADSWIFLNVSYADADLGSVDESSLRMWRYNGTDWEEVSPPNGVNITGNHVYANITSFSIFAPLGNPSGGLNCSCGDICVNETGWWRDGGAFNASATPIQDAVNNATGGEIICVKDGTYHENVDVNTANLTIQSENGNANCVVSASNPDDDVFTVWVDYVNITGFTVENTTGNYTAGICLWSADHCSISSNNATDNDIGIYLNSANNNHLTDNTASSNSRYGVYLWSSNDNHLTNDTESGSSSTGFYLYSSFNNTLTGNTESDSVNPGFMLRESSNNTLVNNTAHDNGYTGFYIFSSSNNNTLITNSAYNNSYYGFGVFSSSCNNNLTNNTAYNNTGSATSSGIFLWDSSSNTLTDNTAYDNSKYGFYIASSSSNNTLTNNTAWNNTERGIYLWSSNNNTLSNNTAYSSDYSFYLSSSDYNNLTNNTAYNNTRGFYLSQGSYNNITGNTAYNSSSYGFDLFLFSNNTLTDNTARDNSEYGFNINDCSNNTLNHNVAYNNTDGNFALWFSTNNTLNNNVAYASSYQGFYVYSSCGNTLNDNTANDIRGSGFFLLDNSSNNTLVNNTAYNSTYAGFELDSSSYNNFTNNTAHNYEYSSFDFFYGFYLDSSEHNTFANNTAYKNHNGFYLESNSTNNSLIGNEAHDNSDSGFYLDSSEHSTLTGNSAYNNGGGFDYGFYISSGDYSNLTDNTAYNNTMYGFYLTSSNHTTLMNNTAYDNSGDGFSLGGYNATLTNNTAHDNGDGFSVWCPGSVLTDNTAYNNTEGLHIYGGPYTLTSNLMHNNTYNFGNENPSVDSSIDTSNTVDGKPIYYVTSVNDTAYDGSTNAGTIYYVGCVNVTLRDIVLSKNIYGVHLDNTTDSTVSNVTVQSNKHGVYLGSSSFNDLADNAACNNTVSGVTLSSSFNNTFTNNTAYGSFPYGFYLSSSYNNTLTDNNVYDNRYGLYLDSSYNNTLTNNTARNNTKHGFFLWSSSNKNTLINNTANWNTQMGIYLTDSSYNRLTNNTASDNSDDGIYLSSSSNNNLTDNTVNSNTHTGINLTDSSNHNTLTNNTASNNSDGIYLYSSNSNNLTNNTAKSNSYGIHLYSWGNNTLTSNTASNNTNYGFYLYFSDNNDLMNNTAGNNAYGVYLTYSENTVIYNNYFDNANNAHDDKANTWNTSKTNGTNIIGGPYLGGNYWSDYSGSDIDGDGLGEAPYNITGGSSKDYLPLVAVEGQVCTCGNICVNETGWWRGGGTFNASATPIQDAVNNATSGDKICVKDGNYTENVDVNTANLTIKSENGSANCVVNASNPDDYVFNVTASYVNITGFTVENATGSNATGIYLYGVNHCNISNNVIRGNNMSGIYLNATHNSILDNNTVSNSGAGIGLENSTYNNVTNNNVSNTSYAIAVWRLSHFNRVINNTIFNTTNFVPSPSSNYSFAIEIMGSSDNAVDNNHVYNTTASGTNASAVGIFIASYGYGPANNNTITNNEIYNTTACGMNASAVGIFVMGGPADNNTITNNELYNATASGSGYTAGFGIYVMNTTGNKLANNTLSSNDWGMMLNSASINTIANNTVNLNNYWGIHLSSSSNSTIYNNYFSNTNNAYDNGNNTWNTTNSTGPNIVGGPYIGGNYWSDYAGNDANGDGFGDTPYAISGGASDYLPLVPPPVHNIDTGEDFYTIQAAIDAVNTTAGHTITVDPGTYNENVDVTKQLTIRSTSGNAADTIVNAANPGDHVFFVTANWVNIAGFTVENATGTSKAGIYLSSAGHCNISNNNATNNDMGIYLSSSSGNGVTGNNMTGGRFGFYLTSSSNNNMVTGNTANSNTIDGMYLAYSSNNTLADNNAMGANYGIYLFYCDDDNRLTGNTANSSNFSGITLYESSNNTLMGNNAAHNNRGISLESSSTNNTLRDNTASNNTNRGIYLDASSSNNTIYNNYFNNTNNAWDNGANTWNTTNSTGPNIIGGPYIGGNYWSDYAGSDTTGDGFGDTQIPYNCTGNIANGGDYLPLILTGATLEGHVGLQGLPATNVTVRFFAPNTTTENVTMKAHTSTDSSGNFTIGNLTPGSYDVAVKGSTSLSNLESGVNFTGGGTTPRDFGVLLEGDASGDDYVDAGDFGILSSAWLSWPGQPNWDARADFSRDSYIDASDFGLLSVNWLKWGDCFGWSGNWT